LARTRIIGAWRSLVAHYTGGVGVVGSNPIAPTNRTRRSLKVLAGFPFPSPAPIYTNNHGTAAYCPNYLGNIWAVCSSGVLISGTDSTLISLPLDQLKTPAQTDVKFGRFNYPINGIPPVWIPSKNSFDGHRLQLNATSLSRLRL
jgi:hypothetical protein